MNLSAEINRLLDLMPASGRMYTKLVNNPKQRKVIAANYLPWVETHAININFDLWEKLPQPQRDLMLLHVVCWILNKRQFRFNLYQGLATIGGTGVLIETIRGEPAGIVMLGGLAVLAGVQAVRTRRKDEVLAEADEAAVEVAQRRGYSEPEAAKALLEAIDSVAQIENRALTVTDVVRSQNLKAMAGLSPLNR
ncbi:hypothetical protein C7B61_07525 [filamentous cyanobacterium CCP1]|nr:hypothetical protein C7B76_31710 [filamentous cyanobacterium CCP2]PSB67179.1 hypothetical protein C7B61_07525 [filamentous cyanobacterium CCP1]